jgi:hypothetical protein
MFPYLVSALKWFTNYAPSLTWYLFLLWFFLANVPDFRLLLPLLFLFEGNEMKWRGENLFGF